MKTIDIAEELRIDRRSVYRLRDRAQSAGFYIEETRGSLKLSEAQRGQVTLSSDQQLHLALLLRHLPLEEQLLFMRLVSPAPPAPLPHRDSTAANPHESRSPLNPEMLASVRSDCRSLITYSSRQRTRQLECSPLATVQDRHRYLIVREHGTGAMRHLRVDHIQDIQKSEHAAERGDFDLDRHIGSGWGPWGWGQEAQHILLRSTSERAIRSILST